MGNRGPTFQAFGKVCESFIVPPLPTPPPVIGRCLQSAVDIDGHEVQLSKYAGKVVIVVNVASACGFTDANYKGVGG